MRLSAILCIASALRLAAAGTAPDAAVNAVNGFAPKLHRELPAQGNTLISPWSLQSALAMVYAGANPPVATEMATALCLPSPTPELHQSFGALRKSLLTVPDGAPPLVIRTANRLFVQQGETLGKPWLETIRTHYAADAESLDFDRRTKAAGKSINSWVNRETNGMIPELVANLDRDTKLVLANAVCLDLSWEERFTASLTKPLPFHLSPKQTKTVPIMFKQHRMRYAKRDGFQIAALPYAGGTLQFVALVPDAIDGLKDTEAKLTPDILTGCAKLDPAEVRLWLPRIKLTCETKNLPETLKRMGMRKAFSDSSFDAIARGLQIDEVIHKTFIELDEDGTKAAAATAVSLARKNGVPHEIPHQKVRADRPFLFMIQHIPTGACVFLGRCADPSQTR